jgi:hypothetical protein
MPEKLGSQNETGFSILHNLIFFRVQIVGGSLNVAHNFSAVVFKI